MLRGRQERAYLQAEERAEGQARKSLSAGRGDAEGQSGTTLSRQSSAEYQAERSLSAG